MENDSGNADPSGQSATTIRLGEGDRRMKILVIRRDNIGDLVCTTPLLSMLRAHFPQAEICALVNSYNAAVLENNPDVNTVYAYTKAKHRAAGQSLLGIYLERVGQMLEMRRKRFDFAILAGGSATRALRLARMVKPAHIIAYADPAMRGVDLPVVADWNENSHEVEIACGLLSALGIAGPPPPVKVYADPVLASRICTSIAPDGSRRLIGIHISSRKPSQRWPAERFVELVRKLSVSGKITFVLLWSPGDESNPLHPGDDRKAKAILAALADQPITGYPTHKLQELIGVLSLCDAVICSDGGAMHLAAGLGKPIVCFFGRSNRNHWRPWGTSYDLLQPESLDVTDITVKEALEGFERLINKHSI
jgi:heptosyltransferase-3